MTMFDGCAEFVVIIALSGSVLGAVSEASGGGVGGLGAACVTLANTVDHVIPTKAALFGGCIVVCVFFGDIVAEEFGTRTILFQFCDSL
jgi:hypothetical protein